MGLDMYFEATFSTRSFVERKFDDRRNAEIDPDFKTTLESIGFEKRSNRNNKLELLFN